ncbi:MAG: DNA-binding protein, partial [Eubacteriales bacterium]|nr:DNA-binding protein [Eubacteriales bacterium]
LKLDVGDEIVSCVLQAARDYHIPSGTVSGLGAVRSAQIGLFDTNDRVYHKTTLTQPLEIVSLTGNLSTKDGEPYAHLHIVLGDIRGNAFGGHLNQAVISATAEIFIQIFPDTIERVFSEDIGLNLMDF